MKMERKKYIVPQCDIVKIEFIGIIAASLKVENGGQSGEDEFEGEATGEARNDWENIWGN